MSYSSAVAAVLGSRLNGFEMTRLKTFIVEDSVLLRENLVAALEELAPVDVIGTAEDETEAVDWIRSHERAFDLLIVDLFLKHGSGLGVLHAATSLHGSMKLVVLSNYATPEIRRRCLEIGAGKVFDKSSEIDALVEHCAMLAEGGA